MRITEIKRQVIESGEPLETEAALINSAGEPEYFDGIYVPTFGPRGESTGLIGYFRNVTERKNAEKALRESYEMLINLTDMVPGVVYQYQLNPDGTSAFPFASRGIEDIYEYSPEDVVEDATPVFGRLHPDDIDRVSADIYESAEHLTPFHCEFRVVLPRQGLRWRVSDAVPHRLDSGGTLWYGIISDVTDRVLALQALERANDRLERILKSIIETMGKVVETRDPYTQGHELGVARLSRQIAEEMGLSEDEVDGIEVAALVHDIGKLAVPAEILTKPGALSEVEFELIKEHARAGYDILKDIDFGWPIADMVLQHHERMDGSGYPCSVTGEEISPARRVLRSPTSWRPCRPTGRTGRRWAWTLPSPRS